MHALRCNYRMTHKELVFYLVQEAAENKGKIDVIAETVLNYLPQNVCQFCMSTSTGQQAMLISHALILRFITLMTNSIGNSCPQQQMKKANFIQFLTIVCKGSGDIAKDLCLQLLRNNAITKLDSFFLQIFQIAFESSVGAGRTRYPYTEMEHMSILSMLCYMAPSAYEKEWNRKEVTEYLPIILEMINLQLNLADTVAPACIKIINRLLHEDLHAFFTPITGVLSSIGQKDETKTLKTIIRKLYFSNLLDSQTNCAEEKYYDIMECSLVVELASLLPNLLPKEWIVLTSNVRVLAGGNVPSAVPLLDLIEATQLIVWSDYLEEDRLEYVLQSLGNSISNQLQNDLLNDMEENTADWLFTLHAKSCRLVGKLM